MKRGSFVVLMLLACARAAFCAYENCQQDAFVSPLAGGLKISSPFSKEGLGGRPHLGADYQCKSRDVMAIADGEVRAISISEKALAQEDPRTGLMKRGYGLYVVVRHGDGSESLYAHLSLGSTKSLKVGRNLKRGDFLGKCDSSGAVTGSHLHLEFAPKGNIMAPDNKSDPDRCISRTGTVALFSNMNLQGGAFRLSLGGRGLGSTDIGQRKEFPLTAIPNREYRLVLTATRAQLGTEASYGLELSENLIFLSDEGGEIGKAQYGELKAGSSMEFRFAVDRH